MLHGTDKYQKKKDLGLRTCSEIFASHFFQAIETPDGDGTGAHIFTGPAQTRPGGRALISTSM